MKNAILISVLLLAAFTAKAQALGIGDVNKYPKAMITTGVDANGDTLVVVNEYTCVIAAPRTFANPKEQAKWDRLKRDVKKAYPYSVLAKMKLSEMDAQMAYMKTDEQRKQYAEKCEKELVGQFEVDMRDLTFTQGHILLKLMDRETNSTTYDIIKERRGSFSAFMWQGVATVFGNNLKSDYDPTGDDANIEAVVELIEMGVI
ncbi:MAG: DUF4294 domain-containing protein [Bacteroidetes bacterium]|nr:DUF4294 domain-containing protein [Bacteroidota bacterium]